jgi:class 3 adenylate cyclase
MMSAMSDLSESIEFYDESSSLHFTPSREEDDDPRNSVLNIYATRSPPTTTIDTATPLHHAAAAATTAAAATAELAPTASPQRAVQQRHVAMTRHSMIVQSSPSLIPPDTAAAPSESAPSPSQQRQRRISYSNPLTTINSTSSHTSSLSALQSATTATATTATTTAGPQSAATAANTSANTSPGAQYVTVDSIHVPVSSLAQQQRSPRRTAAQPRSSMVELSTLPSHSPIHPAQRSTLSAYSSNSLAATTVVHNVQHRSASLPPTLPLHNSHDYSDDVSTLGGGAGSSSMTTALRTAALASRSSSLRSSVRSSTQRRQSAASVDSQSAVTTGTTSAGVAVRAVHRGSEQWTAQLRPFVSDLAYRSIATRRGRYTQYTSNTTTMHHSHASLNDAQSVASHRTSRSNNSVGSNGQSRRDGEATSGGRPHHLHHHQISFQPYTCQAAVLFVDISGYSRITAAIAHKGAHVISAAVNAYLSRLLKIIYQHGGDVVKFAGDAILVVWEGNEQELEINVVCAAYCAVQLQRQAGSHQVDVGAHGMSGGSSGTLGGLSEMPDDDLTFHIHCGLCCGPLDSEIFEAPVHENMQRLYHYVGGDALVEIGDLVDLALAGEICISRNCCNFIENGGTYTHPTSTNNSHNGKSQDHGGGSSSSPSKENNGGSSSLLHGARLLHSLELNDPDLVELMKWHIQKTMADRKARRDHCMEEEFIHDNVLAYLSHGGLSPTHIAQMRNLCVLFIAMTSKGSSVNWLLEVQAILDKNRCPIVQIIHDDKGVHIVAAVNLYEAIPEASLVGIEVCRELIDKRVGACVGVAIGPTFCGVTGSTTACRWDITGPVVVRAARLMQYALVNGEHFAIDQSLYDDPMAATRMLVLDASVQLKGAPEPIAVYTLSDAKLFSAFRILENVHGGVHDQKVQEIQNHISGRHRSAVLVTGIPLAGMTIVCQRAAGFSDLVPYLHLCEVSAGFLQLARTIATWFQYVDDHEVQKLARSVMMDMSSGCWSCAHDLCVRLVNVALGKGYHACFVVDRIHNLDKFSLSLIRECLQTTKSRRRDSVDASLSRPHTLKPTLSSEDMEFNPAVGQICFMCTHMSLYSSKSAADLVQGAAAIV